MPRAPRDASSFSLLAPWPLAGLALAACTALPSGAGGPAVPEADARQIHWQRNLADALALARAEDRPLLVAMNMDGESASDRIVHENYRDPAFVSATRPFVCLVGSVFRHTPRDHDEAGRRIECPRLGGVTCGEHLALEPQLFEAFLADGERVAPRHAVVWPDGRKEWDLSLCFDLHDIDRSLFASARAERARHSEVPWSGGASPATWDELAARRDPPGRARLERSLEAARDEATLTEALDALAAHGDAGSADALALLVPRLAGLSAPLGRRFVTTTRALGLEAELAGRLRAELGRLDPLPGASAALDGAPLLPLLAELDGASAATRATLLARTALEADPTACSGALARAFDGARAAEIVDAVAAEGPLDLRALLQAAGRISEAERGHLPWVAPPRDAMPEEDELEQALNELEERLRASPDDARLLAHYAKASLDLGRRRLEHGGSGALSLLEDADRFLAQALAIDPEHGGTEHVEWWLERARAAYFLGRFADEADFGQQAFALANGASDWPCDAERPAAEGARAALLENEPALEALRWIGDGEARALGGAEGAPAGDALRALRALRALGIVAVSPLATAKDWQSLASFTAAQGLPREAFAIARAGVERFPAARELRQSLNGALWSGERFELAPACADEVVDRNPASADSWWFAGHAWMLAAEGLRRTEQPLRALEAYAASQARFERCGALRDDYAENATSYVAFGWLGRGLAHARLDRRQEAADDLVRAVSLGTPLAGVSDGLGYDVLDLVDKVFEWRETGPSPVAPLALLERLERAAPGDPFWGLAISDSQLREALRADGRNPVRAERDTVDAGGLPIRMLMGLPDEEGDAYLRSALATGRRALPFVTADEDRRVVAQADTIWAERMLERQRLDGVREALAEAAPLMGLEPPASGADAEALGQLAGRLRERLGEARPRWREGR